MDCGLLPCSLCSAFIFLLGVGGEEGELGALLLEERLDAGVQAAAVLGEGQALRDAVREW